jgi:4-deoxy-L-threo-5-hexosulose-uronate ketol-isomerase
MEQRAAFSPAEFKTLDTSGLRARFLVRNLFQPGQVTCVYSQHDRIVVGGLTPTAEPLPLLAPPELRAEHFFDAREAGLVNVGGAGSVAVDGTSYPLGHGDCLYIGRGAKSVVAASSDPAAPAKFYLFSALAHAACPTAAVAAGQGDIRELGDAATSNRRTLNRYIHADGIQSCQVVLGVTQLHTGSMWNTMPAHTHDRRTEAYLYFDLPDDARVIHLVGQPQETRHLVVANEEAVLNPSWSIHSGVGTAAYSFVWAMAGENRAYDDMDSFPVAEMR